MVDYGALWQLVDCEVVAVETGHQLEHATLDDNETVYLVIFLEHNLTFFEGLSRETVIHLVKLFYGDVSHVFDPFESLVYKIFSTVFILADVLQ